MVSRRVRPMEVDSEGSGIGGGGGVEEEEEGAAADMPALVANLPLGRLLNTLVVP